MARTTLHITLSASEAATIRAMLHRADLAPRLRERLEMVKAAALGLDLPTIVQWSERSAETVRAWLARYQAGGIAALADAPRSGRPAKADAAYLVALEQAVSRSPRELGQPFDVWTSGRLSVYLAEQTQVAVSPGWLRVLLARQRFACGRPKHSLKHLQDLDELAACEAELAAVGKKSGGQAGPLRTPPPG